LLKIIKIRFIIENDLSNSPIYGSNSPISGYIQESLHPVQVTEGLWVVPQWCTPPVWLS